MGQEDAETANHWWVADVTFKPFKSGLCIKDILDG